jgi:hypothetical protein
MDGPTRRIRPDAPVVNDGCNPSDSAAVPTNSTNDILSAYAPGRDADVWPAGTAKRVPAGSNIVFEMHYSKAQGAAGRDRTSLALVFAREPVERMVCTRNVRNILFEIPPGAENHEVTACWTFQRDVELISYMPHMHVRGKSMRYEAVFPDGRQETLLSVPNYTFHWQTLYVLRRPVPVPRGTRLVITGHFDNSAKNHHNPDPSKAVRSGSATTDEMMIGFVNFTVPRPRDRVRASVDPKVFDAYVGRYEFDPTARLQVVREGDRLFFEADGARVELFPSSETTFFVTSAESEISFVRDAAGRVTDFVVTLNDELVRFRRVSDK